LANEGALALLNDDEAIEQIAAGALSKQIAAKYGVTPYAVRKRLAKHPDYKQAILSQADSIVEDGMQLIAELDSASDSVAITRARTKAELGLKYAAAINPDKWGNRPNNSLVIDLGSVLQSISERMQGQSKPIDMVQDMGSDSKPE